MQHSTPFGAALHSDFEATYSDFAAAAELARSETLPLLEGFGHVLRMTEAGALCACADETSTTAMPIITAQVRKAA